MDIKKILFKTNEFDAEKALPDAVVYCNKEGKIQWVNDKAAEIFETSKMHLLTSNITDFLETPQILINHAISLHEVVLVKYLSKEIYFDMTAKEIHKLARTITMAIMQSIRLRVIWFLAMKLIFLPKKMPYA